MQPELDFREMATQTLRSYVGLYRRRAQKGDGRAFRAPELNALAALVVQRAVVARPRDFDGEQAVHLMEDLARAVFDGSHVAATDIVGYAWADAYGVLPLEAPPLQSLDAVLVSGAQPGAVGGLYGAVWRGLFLASAIPLLHTATRPLGVEQFHRWIEYIRPRVADMAAGRPATSASELSLRARIGAITAELAHRMGDVALLQTAEALVKPLLSQTPEAGLPAFDGTVLGTGHVAQLATAAASVEEPRVAADLLDRLAVGCFDRERALFHISESDERMETSPWVPLAVAAVVDDSALDAEFLGSRLRRAVFSGRRRST